MIGKYDELLPDGTLKKQTVEIELKPAYCYFCKRPVEIDERFFNINCVCVCRECARKDLNE